MAAVTGTIVPLKDKVIIYNMNFGEEVTSAGLILKSDNGKGEGVHPRWAQVWAVGPEQQDVKVGEWVLMEHARWTRAIKYEDASGEEYDIFMADLKGMMLVSDTKPDSTMRSVAAAAGGNFNFNIPG
jgi:co-chaperonin GroES (HSP10)